MFTKNRSPWFGLWKKPADLNPAINLDERTRSSWARLIPVLTELPPVFRDSFVAHVPTIDPFPYTILTPSREHFIHRTNEKLIVDLGDEVIVLESLAEQVRVYRFPVAQVTYCRYSLALLMSSLTICGNTMQGEAVEVTILFNSISDYLFLPLLQSLRSATGVPADSAWTRELEKFNTVPGINIKFANYARRAMLPGDNLEMALFQPEVRRTVVRFFGFRYGRSLLPPQMALLTARELILISEDPRKRPDDRHGGDWTYIPRRQVADLRTQSGEHGLTMLQIRLAGGAEVSFTFQEALAGDVRNLQRAIIPAPLRL